MFEEYNSKLNKEILKYLNSGKYTPHLVSTEKVQESNLTHLDRLNKCLERGVGSILPDSRVVSRNGSLEYLTSNGMICIFTVKGELNNVFAPFSWYAIKEFPYFVKTQRGKQVMVKVAANKDLAAETNANR